MEIFSNKTWADCSAELISTNDSSFTQHCSQINQRPNQTFNIAVINFQSILAKIAEFSLFISEQQPDIVFGNLATT